ncbi:DUF3011 domain-containing protein [Pseudoluteimonas lycopersici]|uniref:DUF3011 domain-containing protein n=1 Tax=Pseudoluteimonas lycopersici TaxID=1324796 RepID=A0A516V7V0_9GAMM|nr:DUF3011 domain-containing protein [Lysobacter lycopersici]QDQ74544.1 DUF3011 domain-containing protein [Lysobacter lycopersici]
MHRPSLFAAFVVLAFGLATSAILPPAHAQPATRAYAPEQLWTLTTAEQTRVISLEYSEQSGGRRIPADQLRFYLDQVRLSRWTYSRVRQDIAQSLAGNNGGWPPPGSGNTVRCESTDNRTRTCNTPWQVRSQLVRQLSDTRCIEGQSYYSGRGQVTVMNGCRGEFAAGAWSGVTHEVRCESTDNRYRECAAGGFGNVALQRQLSDTRCIRDSNWGTRGDAIWVNRGCRGVFLVGTGAGSGYNVSCSSTSNRPTSCAWNAMYGRPYLQRQLSSTPCREGGNWWYANGRITVQNGCRGLFGAR